jgi:signal transduction histidine kinase
MTEHDLLVTLWDNGVGTSEFTEGIGLSGIRERLNPLNGTLVARNTVDGFKLLITIPYRYGDYLI